MHRASSWSSNWSRAPTDRGPHRYYCQLLSVARRWPEVAPAAARNPVTSLPSRPRFPEPARDRSRGAVGTARSAKTSRRVGSHALVTPRSVRPKGAAIRNIDCLCSLRITTRWGIIASETQLRQAAFDGRSPSHSGRNFHLFGALRRAPGAESCGVTRTRPGRRDRADTRGVRRRVVAEVSRGASRLAIRLAFAYRVARGIGRASGKAPGRPRRACVGDPSAAIVREDAVISVLWRRTEGERGRPAVEDGASTPNPR
jgi:hypothetical protein